MSGKNRIIIYHQNRLFRECLSSALAESAGMEIVPMERLTEGPGPAGPGHCDVLVLDSCLPDMEAFRILQTLRASDGGPRTILLVSSSSPDLIDSCLQGGADGCVLDEDTLDDLRQAIEHVLSGRSYCSPQVARRLFARNGGQAGPGSWNIRMPGCQLTARECEILRLIASRNLSNKQIARELRLSVYTVKNHVHSIIEKLSVEDRQMAARHAVRQGLLGTPLV